MERRTASKIAKAAILMGAVVALSYFAMLTVKKAEDHRTSEETAFHFYGEPIQVEATDVLGQTTPIILTESTVQLTKWERFEAAVAEYSNAAVEVFHDILR